MKLSNNVIFFSFSLFITFILFYIDEGFYNFQWMKSFGSWIVFCIYALVLFVIQVGISELLNRFFNVRNKTMISVVLGIPVAILFLATFIFG